MLTEIKQPVNESVIRMNKTLTGLNNTYVHSKSEIKGQCRETLENTIEDRFKGFKTLNTLTLGGEDLVMENLLSNKFKLNGVSYEKNITSIDKAKSNAPKGIKIIKGDILNHVYKGNEQFIWFDFMSCLRYENVNKLLKWICYNPISSDCVFAVTYTLHCRNIKGEGYRQLFDTEFEHEKFIDEIKNYIGLYLPNNNVRLAPIVNVTRYCNTDIKAKSLPMVQYIFNLHKK